LTWRRPFDPARTRWRRSSWTCRSWSFQPEEEKKKKKIEWIMFDTFQPEEKEEKTQLNGLCSTRLGFCSCMLECTMFNTLLRIG
jgi:hypothetical protein